MGNPGTFWFKAATTAAVAIIYIAALMAPLFCPRSWFSHQLDGHAGEANLDNAEPSGQINPSFLQEKSGTV